MKSLSVFMLIVMMSSSLQASVPKLLYDINASFSNTEYSQLKSIDKLMIMDDTDLESNTTLQQALKSYKKLLPSYLENNLFPESAFEGLGDKHYDLTLQYHYREFYNTSLLHLKILNQNKQYNFMHKIILTHISNLNQLINNSVTMLDYVSACVLYKKIFYFFDLSNQVFCDTLINNPPPPIDLLYEKIEFEKKHIFIETERTLLNSNDFKELGTGYEQLMSNVVKKFKLYYEKYENKNIKALKSGSKQQFIEFKKYLAEERENRHSFFSNILFTYEAAKVKLLYRYGYEADTSKMADHMAEILALVAYPTFISVLDEHSSLIQEHQKYVSKCSTTTLTLLEAH